LTVPVLGVTFWRHRGAHFLGELPAGAAPAVGALAAEPLFVVAYNRAGAEVARLDLQELVAAGSPN
jgi:hypothetical protein